MLLSTIRIPTSCPRNSGGVGELCMDRSWPALSIKRGNGVMSQAPNQCLSLSPEPCQLLVGILSIFPQSGFGLRSPATFPLYSLRLANCSLGSWVGFFLLSAWLAITGRFIYLFCLPQSSIWLWWLFFVSVSFFWLLSYFLLVTFGRRCAGQGGRGGAFNVHSGLDTQKSVGEPIPLLRGLPVQGGWLVHHLLGLQRWSQRLSSLGESVLSSCHNHSG